MKLFYCALLLSIPFLLGFSNQGQPVASPEYIERATKFNMVGAGAKIYFRYDAATTLDDSLMLLKANGSPAGLLKPNQFTLINASYQHEITFEVEEAKFNNNVLVDDAKVIAAFTAKFIPAATNLYISCGSKPLAKLRNQYFILPPSVCQSKSTACADFDKKRQLCASAKWRKNGLGKFKSGQFCGAPTNWEKVPQSSLAGIFCTMTMLDEKGESILDVDPQEWPEKTDPDETAVFDHFRHGEGRLTLVEPLMTKLVSPMERDYKIAIGMNTVTAYKAIIARYPDGNQKGMAGDPQHRVLQLQHKAFEDAYSIHLKQESDIAARQTIKAGEAFLRDYKAMKSGLMGSVRTKLWMKKASQTAAILTDLDKNTPVPDTQCKPSNPDLLIVEGNCKAGLLQGYAVLADKQRKSQLRAHFKNGKPHEGALYYKTNGEWWITYEGGLTEYQLDGSSRAYYGVHGQGRSYSYDRSGRIEYEGEYRRNTKHGEGFCRLGKSDRFEPCRYRDGQRVDDLPDLRRKQAKLRKELAAQGGVQAKKTKVDKACGSAFSKIQHSMEMSKQALKRPDSCSSYYDQVAERASDSFWLETYDGSDNRPIGDMVIAARLCRKKQDSGYDGFWYSANNIPKEMRILRNRKCPQLTQAKPYEAFYRAAGKQVENRALSRERYEEKMLQFERKLVAAGDRRYAQQNAQWLRELTGSLMRPKEFERSLQNIQKQTLHKITQLKIRTQKSYGSATKNQTSSESSQLRAIDKKIKNAEREAATRFANAEKRCKKSGRKWLGDHCKSEDTLTAYSNKVRSKPSTKSDATSNGVNQRVTGTDGKTALKKPVKVSRRSVPIFIQKEGPSGWSTKEQACSYAKAQAIRMAENSCRTEHKGTRATTSDVPQPVDANCQSYRKMEKAGFTHAAGDWKVTGNVILYCRLPVAK